MSFMGGAGAGGIQTIINIDQDKVLKGKAFYSAYAVELANNAETYSMFETSSAVFHYNICLFTQVLSEFVLIEDATATGGTALTVLNMNRTSSNPPPHTVSFGVVYSGGTIIIPSGTGAGLYVVSGQTNLMSSFMLAKPNTKTAFLLKNRSGGTGEVGYVLYGWYN